MIPGKVVGTVWATRKDEQLIGSKPRPRRPARGPARSRLPRPHHGNAPIIPSTDHRREYVPLLVYGHSAGRNLGARPSFNDHAVAAYFGVPFETDGTPF